MLIEREPRALAEEVAPYLARHLERWPDALRRCPERWLPGLLSGRPDPRWPLVREVMIFAPRAGGAQAPGARAASNLEHISRLHIYARGSAPGRIQALLGAKWRRLQAVSLDLDQGELAPLMEQLLEGRARQTLRELALRGSGCDDAVLEVLAEATPALRRLTLRRGQITDAGVRQLIGGGALGALQELVLDLNPIGDAGLRALARAEHLERLEMLSLSGCEISAAGARALARSTHAPRLEVLVLARNYAGASWLREARHAEAWRRLRILFLDGAEGDQGARALAQLEGLEQLEQLVVGGLSAQGARALARASNLPDGVRQRWSQIWERRARQLEGLGAALGPIGPRQDE